MDTTTPITFTTTCNSAHWIGAPAIATSDIGLVHPASNLVRLGTVTATVQGYSYPHYVVGTTAGGGKLDVTFDDRTWRYSGPEGSAQGLVTAWW